MNVTQVNAGKARSYGGEFWATWQVRDRWRLSPSYSYLEESRSLPGADYAWDGAAATIKHQSLLRSQHDLGRNWQFDAMLRARSRNIQFSLPGVVLADLRLGWRAAVIGDLSLTLHNATNRRILEMFPEGPFIAIPTRRTFVVKWVRLL
jgi:outer membrane receptor protein involved in Fe transport